jgi:hypothetical protein
MIIHLPPFIIPSGGSFLRLCGPNVPHAFKIPSMRNAGTKGQGMHPKNHGQFECPHLRGAFGQLQMPVAMLVSHRENICRNK